MVVTKALSIDSLLLIFLIKTLLEVIVRLKSTATLTKENPVIKISYPLVNTVVNDARLV